MSRFISILILVLAMAPMCFGQEEIVLKNAGLSRTVSGAAGILKTTKLEANSIQMLDGPSVEFMIEIEYKGKNITLVPSDFDIKETDSMTHNREINTYIRLDSHVEEIPLRIYVNYYRDLKQTYMQKSISVTPCKEPAGAILKRVMIEDMMFRGQFQPVSPINRFAGVSAEQPVPDLSNIGSRFRFDANSDFAAIDPKTNKGIYFFVSSATGKEFFTLRHSLIMAEEMNVPLAKGYETGRATIGAVYGPPEVLYKRFREFLWNTYCSARKAPSQEEMEPGKPVQSPFSYLQAHLLGTREQLGWADDAAVNTLPARQQRYIRMFVFPSRTLRVNSSLDGKRFAQYADVYQHILDFPDGSHIDGEGHIIDNKGFIVLFNHSDKAQKIVLPLDEPGLELKGSLKLTDRTNPDSSADLGTAKPTDKVEVEITPGGTKVVGVNI